MSVDDPFFAIRSRNLPIQLRMLLNDVYVTLMETRVTLKIWWQPLPLWLKLVTIFITYPAWFFVLYCIFSGQAKSIAAIGAFCAFAFSALLHIMFDSRNRQRGRQTHRGFEMMDVGD
ncbi:MAG: hypothetical protein A3H25_06680 [Sphingomonadales bacterium RIFCSPLOWO2_12_FULL_63_15]|nr:MAG: hypothetical protein A3H25_06680 [Sphingomonadales bacterium RIFCSPLOWO2_12_FULL_63_15]